MFRIFRPALVVFASVLLCVGLIATRPLPADPSAALGSSNRALQVELTPTLEVRPVEPTPAIAPIERPRQSPLWAGAEIESVSVKAESLRIRALLAPAAKVEPAPEPAPAPVPVRIPGNGPRMAGTLVAQTERLDFYVGKNTFSAQQVAELAPLIERLLRKDEQRFGTK